MIRLLKSNTDNYGDDDLITYHILEDEQSLGYIELYETENPQLLVIAWIDIPDSLGSRTREVIKALKRIYPKVTKMKSLRITGTHEEMTEGETMTEVRI